MLSLSSLIKKPGHRTPKPVFNYGMNSSSFSLPPVIYFRGKKSWTNPKHTRKQQRSENAALGLRAAEIFNSGDAQRVITSGKKNKKSLKKIRQKVLSPYMSKLSP